MEEVGGLIANTYTDYTLKQGVETEISIGTGVYYISNSFYDSVSLIVLVNYSDYYTLGTSNIFKFRVLKTSLYVTPNSDQNIRVRTIYKK